MHTRTRYVLTFGKYPGNDWYSDSLDKLKEDYERMKDKIMVHTFEVNETITDTGEVVKREDRPIYLQ